MLPLWLMLGLATLFSMTNANVGVDTWLALAGGRHILAHGVDDVDPFSFNSRPSRAARGGDGLWSWLEPTGWINQNWLSKVILASITETFGRDALVLWKILTYIAVAALLVATARLYGAPFSIAVAASAAALVASRDFLEIRAQDFTNLLVAVLFLLLALTTRRSPRWSWSLVPLFAVWANSHGGFIYGLLVLVVFVAVEVAALFLPGALGSLPSAGVRTTVVASALGFATTVVASPYRLANLTHPAAVTVSKDAALWRTVSEWQPLFGTGYGSTTGFLFLAGLTLTVLAATVHRTATRDRKAGRQARGDGHSLDPVVPGAWAVAVLLLSFAMTLTSRRFVPVACITTAPFLAAWLGRNLGDCFVGWSRRVATHRLTTAVALWSVTIVATIVLGLRLHATFVRPWPLDATRTSPFDRLTRSYLRPWGLCSFLTLNQVHGRMWNPWIEGGFLAWCQTPDRKDGHIPLQLIVDGRAQRAYEVDNVQTYFDLKDGRWEGIASTRTGVELEGAERAAAIAWVEARLRELDISLVYVSRDDERTMISRTMFSTPAWQAVYVDDRDMLMADTRTLQGKALAEGVFSGSTRFPAGPSSLLTQAYVLLRRGSGDNLQQVIELASQILRDSMSPRAVHFAALAARTPDLEAKVEALCVEIVEDMRAHSEVYARQRGYRERSGAALEALAYLHKAAQARGDQQRLAWVQRDLDRLHQQRDRLERSLIR